jgi:serine/threonine protein kinase
VTALDDGALDHLRRVVVEPEIPGDRFVVLGVIGQGGMGQVYRVRDRLLERDIALKVLRPELATPDGVERMEQESRILARLAHPGIVPIHDIVTLADGRPGYFMRLVTGQRLDQLDTSTTLPERLRLFLRLCEAVEFAHQHQVIHRDLKPANVMLGEFGEVLVLDWGIAHLGSGSDPATRAGTPGFMAPEQLAGSAVDARTDVFALGAILQQLAGDVAGGTRMRQLSAVWRRAMAPDPSSRYGSVRLLADDVAHYLDGEAVSAYRETAIDRIGRFYSRYQVPILLVVAYLVMRLLFIIWRGTG